MPENKEHQHYRKLGINFQMLILAFIAESVSFSVCSFFNLDVSDYAFPYITGWSSSKDLKELRTSMDLIRETSGRIISSLEEKLKFRDSRDAVLSIQDVLAEGKRHQADALLKEPYGGSIRIGKTKDFSMEVR